MPPTPPSSTAPTQEVRPVLRPCSSRVVTLPLSGIDHEAAVEALADLYASGAVSPEVAGAVAVLLGFDAERGTPHPDVIRLLRGLVVSFETRAGER